jgi:hypothetical protein
VNLDQMGRAAGAELRHEATRGARPMAMLEELRSADRRQRVSAWVLGAVAVVVAAFVGWQLHGTVLAGHQQAPAGPTPSVRMHPAGAAAYELQTPLTVTLPHGWWGIPSSSTGVDFYSGTNGYGVSVGEGGAWPATFARTPTVDRRVGTDPQSQAQWLASRSYLVTSGATQVTLDGRPAWQVDVHERPGAKEISPTCDNAPPPCVPLFVGADGTPSGIWGSGHIRYVFATLPDGSTVSVSVWDFSDPTTGFEPGQTLIDSIHFGTG